MEWPTTEKKNLCFILMNVNIQVDDYDVCLFFKYCVCYFIVKQG